jgi:hypothetical protein
MGDDLAIHHRPIRAIRGERAGGSMQCHEQLRLYRMLSAIEVASLLAKDEKFSLPPAVRGRTGLMREAWAILDQVSDESSTARLSRAESQPVMSE